MLLKLAPNSVCVVDKTTEVFAGFINNSNAQEESKNIQEMIDDNMYV